MAKWTEADYEQQAAAYAEEQAKLAQWQRTWGMAILGALAAAALAFVLWPEPAAPVDDDRLVKLECQTGIRPDWHCETVFPPPLD